MRIGGQAAAVHFLAEAVQLLFVQAAFEVGTRVHARGDVALEVNQIAFLLVVVGAPEVVEADVVEGGGGLEGGNVAPQFQVFLAGAQHQGHRVPAVDGADAVLHLVIAGGLLLFAHRDSIQVCSRRLERQVCATATGTFDHFLQQEVGTLGAVTIQYRLQRIGPFVRFNRIDIVRVDCCHLTSSLFIFSSLPGWAASAVMTLGALVKALQNCVGL
ncbi:hypothetical protein D3C85_1324190 [compost metagenome]